MKARSKPRRTRKKPARIPRRYGWIPDLPDQRDYLYRVIHPLPGALPPAVDLRKLCSAVEDQGRLGSCTANALAGAMEFLERKDQLPFKDLSRLFIYYNERVLIDTVDVDSGAMLRDRDQDPRKAGGVHGKEMALRHLPVRPASAGPLLSRGRRVPDHILRAHPRSGRDAGMPCGGLSLRLWLLRL